MTDRERLIELLDKTFNEQFYKRRLINAELTADYILADGWIRPPCKVGDTVYQIDTAGNVYESVITKTIYDTNGIAFDESSIGKSIFLTRKEAEKAIKDKS